LARFGTDRSLPFGAPFPGWSSMLGGIEEFPLFRDSKCSSFATFAANRSY
jgi:hypothetical protein